jgi:phosphatidylglycerol lysyltransferase
MSIPVVRSRALGVLRRGLVTSVLIVVYLVTAIATHGFAGPSASQSTELGTGFTQVVLRGRWWTPLTSVVVTNGGFELVFVLLCVVVLVGISERAMGSLRTLLAFVVTATLGAAIGITAQAVGNALGEVWSIRVSGFISLDPMTALAGVALTATAFAGRLWRRRVRVLLLAMLVVFMLYGGQPADLYRLCGGIVGVGLGYALRPSDGSPFWPRSSHHEARVLIAAVTAITALGPAVTLLSRPRLGPLAPLGMLIANARPISHQTLDRCLQLQTSRDCLRDVNLERISGVGPVLLTLLPLVALLIAALGILRGRSFGAWLAVVVNVAMAALAALYYGFVPLFPEKSSTPVLGGLAWEMPLDLTICTLFPIAVAIVVLASMRHFTIRTSARVVRLYLVGVVISLFVLAGLYVVLGLAFGDQFRPRVTAVDLLSDLPDRFAPVGFLSIEPLEFRPAGPVAGILYDWVGPLFWLVVILGALAIITRRSRREIVGRARAIELLRTGGGGSLSYWGTWEGNHYWFSPDGQAAVAYRVVNGIAVTTSEPFGNHQSALAAVAQFARYCDDNGWVPFYYGIHPEFAGACLEMGWSVAIVGDETIVYPAEWNTTGKQWQDVRTSINRAERDGVRSIWTRFSELTPRHVIQIEAISEAWVAEKELPEMGFTLGGIDELRDDEVGLMIAVNSADQIVGITSWLPSYTAGAVSGWTLDFMRRVPDGPNGVMEFLIARSAEQFRQDGIEFLSLSTAPLTRNNASVLENTGIARMLRYIGARLEPVYGFSSLFNFKRKFQPEFRPVYMAYPDSLALPTIGIALARTYVPSMSPGQAVRFMRSLNR